MEKFIKKTQKAGGNPCITIADIILRKNHFVHSAPVQVKPNDEPFHILLKKRHNVTVEAHNSNPDSQRMGFPSFSFSLKKFPVIIQSIRYGA
jgi:hypothetical protein